MNKKIVLVLIIAAFFAGDYQACLRIRKGIQPIVKKLATHIEIQDLKLDSHEQFATAQRRGLSLKEARREFAHSTKFISVLENGF